MTNVLTAKQLRAAADECAFAGPHPNALYGDNRLIAQVLARTADEYPTNRYREVLKAAIVFHGWTERPTKRETIATVTTARGLARVERRLRVPFEVIPLEALPGELSLEDVLSGKGFPDRSEARG